LKNSELYFPEQASLGDFAHEFYDLRDVIVVFAVPRARSGIEEIVTSSEISIFTVRNQVTQKQNKKELTT
jgi:hypothetical protein